MIAEQAGILWGILFLNLFDLDLLGGGGEGQPAPTVAQRAYLVTLQSSMARHWRHCFARSRREVN